MLWHVVLIDASGADAQQRDKLRMAVEALAGIEEVLWLGHGTERDGATVGFVSILRDSEALHIYRATPLHLELAAVIRASGAVVHRLDFEGPPPPPDGGGIQGEAAITSR